MKKERKNEKFVGVICISTIHSSKLQLGMTYFIKDNIPWGKYIPLTFPNEDTTLFFNKESFVEDPEYR
jgi:hypothetical protein